VRRFELHGDLEVRQAPRPGNVGGAETQERKDEIAANKNGEDGSENELGEDNDGCCKANVCKLEPGVDQWGDEVAHLGECEGDKVRKR
jgi:hypothetical protein